MAIMSMEEWNDFTRKIIAANGDQSTLTTLLTQGTNDYGELFAENATINTELEKVREDNKKLQEANMGLFLQLTDQKRKEVGGQEGDNKQEDRAEKITIEDLFKEEK